jgi:hypothetical protein
LRQSMRSTPLRGSTGCAPAASVVLVNEFTSYTVCRIRTAIRFSFIQYGMRIPRRLRQSLQAMSRVRLPA